MSAPRAFIMRFSLLGGIAFILCYLLLSVVDGVLYGIPLGVLLADITPGTWHEFAHMLKTFAIGTGAALLPFAGIAWLLARVQARRNLRGLAFAALFGGIVGAICGAMVGAVLRAAAPFLPEEIGAYVAIFTLCAAGASVLLAACLLPKT